MYKLHYDSRGPWRRHDFPLLFHGYLVTPEFDRVIEGCRYRPKLVNIGNIEVIKTQLGRNGLREPVMIKSAPDCC
jgi:hypothetical protein